jgi:multidrug efflux pump subunit AcrB
MGKVFSIIPTVVLAVFLISLIESLFILPAHLRFRSSSRMRPGTMLNLITFQKKFSGGFEYFITAYYTPFLSRVIDYRYTALAIFITVLMVMGAYVSSGRVGLQLFPRVEADYAFATAVLKVGTADHVVKEVENQILRAAQNVIEGHGATQLSKGIFAQTDENKIEMRVLLTESGIRPISTTEFTNLWRDKTGEIAGLESLIFTASRGGPGSGPALTVELSHRDTETLDKAAADLAKTLGRYSNTQDIDDGAAQGKKQYDFTMTDLGYTLGMTPSDVGRQVRAAFYGQEALKQQRGRNEVRVLVRLPEEERDSSYYLWNMMIKAPNGADVLLKDVVQAKEGRAYTTIYRRDSQRIINVTSDVNPPSEAGNIISEIQEGALVKLQQDYPDLTYSFEGQQAEMRDSMQSLMWGMLMIIFVMYAILAVLFSSYSQPFMVLIAIPFSMVGAIIGHFIMGYSLSIVSMFGIIALAGVVVNDSLILIDLANRKKKKNPDHMKAVIASASQRFRPIMLTTLTTFVGLMPMILETSRQAKFLIPMAISLGFGILFATFLTLILIPCLYMIIEDLKKLKQKVKHRLARPFVQE